MSIVVQYTVNTIKHNIAHIKQNQTMFY